MRSHDCAALEAMSVVSIFYRVFERKGMAAMMVVCLQETGSICIHPARNLLTGWKDIRASWKPYLKTLII